MAINKNPGDTVTLEFTITNTGASAARFSLAFEFGAENPNWFSWWFNGLVTPTINPGETRTFTAAFVIPSDAPLDLYYSPGANVYPEGSWNSNDPHANKLDGDSVFGEVYLPPVQGGTFAEIDIISVT